MKNTYQIESGKYAINAVVTFNNQIYSAQNEIILNSLILSVQNQQSCHRMPVQIHPCS